MFPSEVLSFSHRVSYHRKNLRPKIGYANLVNKNQIQRLFQLQNLTQQSLSCEQYIFVFI
jgi:hypothetical protein